MVKTTHSPFYLFLLVLCCIFQPLCTFPAFHSSSTEIYQNVWKTFVPPACSLFPFLEGRRNVCTTSDCAISVTKWISIINLKTVMPKVRWGQRSLLWPQTVSCPCECILPSIYTINLCMQGRTSHVWGIEIEARDRLLTSEDCSDKKHFLKQAAATSSLLLLNTLISEQIYTIIMRAMEWRCCLELRWEWCSRLCKVYRDIRKTWKCSSYRSEIV